MQDIVLDLGMQMQPEMLEEFRSLMEGSIASYDVVDALPDEKPVVRYPRTPGYRPGPEENGYNAWSIKTTIKGAPGGKLAGKTVAVKDNVCVAGVPMMNGAATLEGYVPDLDATIVTRMLDAGATILGKAHCECFCLSGGSHTGAAGPVHNPHKHGYSAGGSSSGSGALVAAGEVDMAIGGDQGGSIRIPAAFCGIYGMKPSWGLVPYTGVMPIESTIDHTGPMTATVADNALLLEVLAGEDGLDPRQYAPKVASYTEALDRGCRGLKIGIVKEGFGWANSESDVDAKVKAAGALLGQLGATVQEISLPMHRIGKDIWAPIALEGLQVQMMNGNGMGFNWKGLYTVGLLDAHAAWRERANDLSDSLKISMFLGEYFVRHYRGRYYAKAQNIARRLKAAYDAALGDCDLLLMPTLPVKATPIPAADAPLGLYLQRAFEMIANTAPFDVTGHPAMTVPCGMGNGLPIGAMLVGKQWDEVTIYRAAAAFERAGDWKEF
jgi:amidase